MTTVLITGAQGNLGTKIAAHFTRLGWTLRLLDLDCADLTIWDENWVAMFAGVDAVIHLAGSPSPRTPWHDAVRLNIDMTQKVYEAAVREKAKRVIFASSNWTMAAHRFDTERLRPDMPPCPVNPYGISKLVGERMGRSYHERDGLEVICLRIGYCQRDENLAGRTMGMGRWGQEMWLSNRDLCQGMERAVLAEDVGFAVLNLMSDNPGMRWDLTETRRVIGYVPLDGASPDLSDEMRAQESEVREIHAQIAALQARAAAFDT